MAECNQGKKKTVKRIRKRNGVLILFAVELMVLSSDKGTSVTSRTFKFKVIGNQNQYDQYPISICLDRTLSVCRASSFVVDYRRFLIELNILRNILSIYVYIVWGSVLPPNCAASIASFVLTLSEFICLKYCK